MSINHHDALSLEWIARGIYNSDRLAFGGMISADYFEVHPFDAAVISLAPFYHKNINNKDIKSFIEKYRKAFDQFEKQKNPDQFVSEYVRELEELVVELKQDNQIEAYARDSI